MNVMVAAVKAVLGSIKPAFELQRQAILAIGINHDLRLLHVVLRTSAVGDLKGSWRQPHRLAIDPIDMRLEEEIGCDAFGL